MARFPISRSLVLAGLVVVLGLFAEEAWHLERWDTKGERHILRATAPAGCTPRKEGENYLWCDVPGFGKALYWCTTRLCALQDLSAPQMSLQERERDQSDMDRMFPVAEDSK